MIEVGHPEGWGRFLELHVNKDHSGLGYHSQQSNLKKPMTKATEGQVLPLQDIFTSVEQLVDGQVSVVEEEEENIVGIVGLVYQKIEGQNLTNWTFMIVPEVTMMEE